VARLAPFHWTKEFGSKLAPETVSVKLAAPAVAESGLAVEMEGPGLAILKLREEDVPPPGAGVLTVTPLEPGAAMSAAGTVAVRTPLLMKTLAKAAPFHWTLEAGSKLKPYTVKAKLAPSAAAEAGLRAEMEGAGLAKVRAAGADAPPPGAGVTTVTPPSPGAVMSPAGTTAVSVELLT
jgi:hypothetical protein